MADDWSSRPFAPWLEESIKELMTANPIAIAMEMVDENGLVSTCYYDTSPNIRACMIDAMMDDAREEWVRGNIELIRSILDGNDEDDSVDDEDEPCETD